MTELSTHRTGVTAAKRIVVKIGSAMLTDHNCGLYRDRMSDWSRQIAGLMKTGKQLVVVSSGAIAEGMSRLSITKQPGSVAAKQAIAAVGQIGLASAWEESLANYGLHTAQILLSRDDIQSRKRYLNTRSALSELLAHDTVPIINENDTVATDELRLGDNDTLAGMIVNLIDAQLLVILTDQDGLYNSDPRTNADAELIAAARVDDPSLRKAAGTGSGILGRGGMRTKLTAAQQAASSKACTVIARGTETNVLMRIIAGEQIGTLLTVAGQAVNARRQWLMSIRPAAAVVLDDGAVKKLQLQGSSLLPIGITAVQGSFQRGDVISCLNSRSEEIARGLSNYDSEEVKKIRGYSSDKISSLLGYGGDQEVIHRDYLSLIHS